MKRPSGTTVVTAILGAFVTFGIVSSYLTKGAEEIHQVSRYGSAGGGLGHLLNGGAWKAGFVRGAGEPAPASIPASLPVVASPHTAFEMPPPAARGSEVAPAGRSAEEITKAAPTESEDAARVGEPKKESEPPPLGRMGLAGPAVQHRQTNAPAEALPDPPQYQALAPAPSVSPPQPQPQEFGPSIFKPMDALGMN